MPLNVKLLRKIKKHILAKPRRFLMYELIVRSSDYYPHYYDDAGRKTKFESCGTAACIAGWACLLTDGIEFNGDAWERGKKLLGLDERKANRLFNVGRWGKLDDLYHRAKSAKARAQIAAKRIEQFIKQCA